MTMIDNFAQQMTTFSSFESVENLEQVVTVGLSLLRDDEDIQTTSTEVPGNLILPDLSPTSSGLDMLRPLPSLYLAFELEQAGLLTTAEKISGLYFAGAIDQSLGEAEKPITDFWNNRHTRLNLMERESLLDQAFEGEVFYSIFSRLCEAIVTLSDNGNNRQIGEEVNTDILLQQLREFFFSRPLGLISYAANDILKSVKAAMEFMKQRQLLTAFGVRSIWELLSITGNSSSHINRQHAEMASAGMYVLSWLVSPEAGQSRLGVDPHSQRLYSMAHRWILAYTTLRSYKNTTQAASVTQYAPQFRANI
jgi:hypothetical protein